MPGTNESMPNFARPLVFSGMSRRSIHWPTTLYSLGFLSVSFLRSSSENFLVIGALATISPYEMERPVGRWRTALRAATHSSAGTFQYCAAASTSAMRAAAPARESVSNVQLTLQLPPVSISPYFGSLVG